ncbi:hypothetical protein ABZZ74_48325 [Streptomyces sp. NPDC006476]
MLVLALVMPILMMAALFALDALEDLLFPLPTPADGENPTADMQDGSSVG